MRIVGRRLSQRALAIAVAAVVAITAIGGYVAVGGEYNSTLGARVVSAPFSSITASRASAPSGTVVHLEGAGAPDRAYAEFRSGARRTYSPAYPSGAGVDVIVPLIREDGNVTGGDVELRLLSPLGPVWSASSAIAFGIEAPPAVAAKPGMVSLFAVEVARALTSQTLTWASAAAGAGTSVPQAYLASLATRTTDLGALSAELEAAAGASGDSVSVSGLSGARADLASADRLIAAQLAGWGPASPSPCGEDKDKDATSVATGLISTIAAVKQAALRYATAVATCDATALGDLSRRAKAWAQITAYEMYLDVREVPKLLGLLLLRVVSIGDNVVSGARLWREAMLGRDLRSMLLEQNGTVHVYGDDVYVEYDVEIAPGATERVRKRLSAELEEAAAKDTLLGKIIAGQRATQDLERAVLDKVAGEVGASVAAKDKLVKALADTVPAAPPAPAAPAAQPAAPPAAAAQATPTLVPITLPGSGGALTLAGGTLIPATVGTDYTFSLCQPAPRSATDLCPRSLTESTTNPKGGGPPYRFQLASGSTLPPGLSLNLNGTFAGRPSIAGRFDFSVCVVDVGGNSVCQPATINVGAQAAAAPVAPPVAATAAPTAAPAAFNVEIQSRIKMVCGGDSRLFFTLPAGVSDALTRISATPSTFSFSRTTTRSESIFIPCNATGTITVHRSSATRWSITLEAAITTSGYGNGVVLEITPLGTSSALAVSCTVSAVPGSTRAIGTVSFSSGGCSSTGSASYSGTNPAGRDTFTSLQVTDNSKVLTNATGRVTITFTLQP